MSARDLSVIVVSSGRPEALRRCLNALAQQDMPDFQLIVVADAAGRRVAEARAGEITILPQAELDDGPNISRARNSGVMAAGGDLIAFIDDDAVAEPSWTRAIVRAFADPEFMAATGPVLGRNGISLQWGEMAVNALAEDLQIEPDRPVRAGFVRKLNGTNMVFRRAVFEQIGGFDEAMAFYLDDTDIALRVGQAGMKTAWIPDAVVHHGFAASTRRREDRIPLSLFDIGASSAVFLGKHATSSNLESGLATLERDQTNRLFRLARRRRIDADQVSDLMQSLKQGIAAGRTRISDIPSIAPNQASPRPFQTFVPAPMQVLAGRWFSLSALRAEAAQIINDGGRVSLFAFEPTIRRHTVRFHDGGWWEQTGGLFGASDRGGPFVKFVGFRARLHDEIRRIYRARGLPPPGEQD